MDTVEIQVRPRYLAGSDVAKKIRRAGLLPGVMYGVGIESRAVATDPKPLTKALNGNYGRNQLFTFKVAGEDQEYLALPRQIDVHPVSRKLRHVDFYVVKADTAVQVTLPIRLLGRSEGQKVGGRLAVHRREVRVKCTPETMPASIDVDLTPFETGEGMTVDELFFPEGVVPVYRKSFRVFDVDRAKLEIEETEEEGEEGEEGEEEAVEE